MNALIKKFLNYICHLLTCLVNFGQNFMCRRESVKLWKISDEKPSEEDKEAYKRHKAYLKRFGFKAVKRDFYVYARYLREAGNDPMYIIPTTIVHKYLTAILNPIPYNDYMEDKNMFDKILPREYLPHTLFRRMGGKWYDSEYQMISFEKVREIISSNVKGDGFIVKPTHGNSGKGIVVFRKEGNIWNSFDGRGDFVSLISKSEWGAEDLIGQELIVQNEFLNHFCDTAVNTFRIIIYNSPINGSIRLIWSGLKIARQGSVVDNVHSGNLVFGVDRNGKLATYGCDQYGNKFSKINGIDFAKEEIFIPHYNKIIDLVKTLCPKLLPHRLIAFDIALDKDGNPVIIEYNLRGYSGWYCQFSGSYMLGDKTDEILSYLSEHRKNVDKFYYKIN